MKIRAKLLSLFILEILLTGVVTSHVQAVRQEPSFPSCSTKIGINGDWSYSPSGTQYIVGVGNREGRDDVYNLTSGNFLQCFCPTFGATGIQSNWWNVENLSREIINDHKSHGWMEVSGADYNLYHKPYLVKNSDYTCKVPTVTPTPSPLPSPTVTSTPTSTPSVTPTVSVTPGPQSRCFDLEASPESGAAPLTVRFTAHADDPVSGGGIKEYRFDFADASGGQPQVWYQTDRVSYHRYERSGEYEASLRVRDNAGNWRESDDCKVKIKVSSSPQVLGTSTVSELPRTGVSFLLVTSVSTILVFAGRYLYKRFKLV